MNYLRVISFFIFSYLLRIKLEFLKKTASKDTIEAFINKWVKKWTYIMNSSFKVSTDIEGLENLPEGNCLFIANHQGIYDIIEMIAVMPKTMGFIAKKEMLGKPIFPYWMEQIKCVFLDRENPREAIKTLNKASEYLKEGYSMTLFPEGTRSKDGQIGEFKKGSLKIATKTPHIPIVPVAIEGTYKAFEENKRFRSTKVKMKVGKPIYIEELSQEDKKDLAQYCEIVVKNLYKDMMGEN